VAGLHGLSAQVAGGFGRVEPRRQARSYLLGFLAQVERKNGWQLAEAAGDATPDRMQRLLNNARWSAGKVRNDLRAYVVEYLGDPGGVLIVDETGFLKKGTRSARVQRQYSGTAGAGWRTASSGVFLRLRLTLLLNSFRRPGRVRDGRGGWFGCGPVGGRSHATRRPAISSPRGEPQPHLGSGWPAVVGRTGP
jgi:hypothetical protein